MSALETTDVPPTGKVHADDQMSTTSTPPVSTTAHDGEKEKQFNSSPPTTPAAPAGPPAGSPGPPPDGGLKAWMTVAGGSLCLFLSFGFINAFAVFETQYQVILTSDNSASDIAWIGSFQLFMIAASSLPVGQIFDRVGPRPLLALVTILYPFSCMMNSLAHTYWQIFICQGILLGVSISLTYAVPISIIPQWFLKKRGIATAIVVAGSSLGGVLWPIIVLHLLNEVGYGWTWRIIGFMALALLTIATLLITRRNEPDWITSMHLRRRAASIEEDIKTVKPPKKPFLYLDAFKHPPYALFTFAIAMAWFGMFYTFFYLSSLAGYYGSSQAMQFYAISILNAVSTFGRIIPGFLADKYGAMNIMIACMFGSTIIILSQLGLSSSAGVIIMGAFYGFTSGGMVSLIVPCLAKTVKDMSRIGTAIGQTMAVSSIFALLGAPICGFIIQSKGPDQFYWNGAVGFSSALVGLSAVMMVVTRMSISRDWRARV